MTAWPLVPPACLPARFVRPAGAPRGLLRCEWPAVPWWYLPVRDYASARVHTWRSRWWWERNYRVFLANPWQRFWLFCGLKDLPDNGYYRDARWCWGPTERTTAGLPDPDGRDFLRFVFQGDYP